jgi:hypothetical protein
MLMPNKDDIHEIKFANTEKGKIIPCQMPLKNPYGTD